MVSRLSYAALAAALFISGPAVAWEPKVVGLDDPTESATTVPSFAADEITLAPIQPHVVGIEDDAEYAPAASPAPVEGLAYATPWDPEIVGLYHEDEVQAQEAQAAAGSRDVAAMAKGSGR